jgi:molybdenum cofactor synthesis domain-containing protein
MEQGVELVGRALVVVVDDRTAHGDEDHSGPLVTELLTEAGFVVDGVVAVAADEVEIRNALNTAVIGGVDLVVSVGGTGVTPRDVTPEATLDIPTAKSSVSPRRSARQGCPRASSKRGCRAVWPGSRAARWWSTLPVRGTRCATGWRRSTRLRRISSANSPAWRSDTA